MSYSVHISVVILTVTSQAFISFFFRQPKKKKVVKVAAGRKRKHSQGDMQNRPEEFELSPGEAVADGEQLMDGNYEDDDMSAVDDGKAAHDDAAVKSVHAQAVNIAREEFGIEMTPKEESEALGLFAKVAGLACHLHDSPTLQQKFEKLVDAQPELSGMKKALDRRVVTRWNSDFTCLAAHIYFEIPVKQLTSNDRNDLQLYALSHMQWRLAKQLEPVLEIFQDLTNLFSQAKVPLVHETVPMLERLEHQLTAICDDAEMELPAVIRITAQASLPVVGKYYALTDDTDVYQIAIAMCPDKKLEWFNKNPDWRSEDRAEVARILQARWTEAYAGTLVGQSSHASTVMHAAPSQKVHCAEVSTLRG
ncbi:hypothetical protein BKA93DRAFT_735840 [Sparassis latifolia]